MILDEEKNKYKDIKVKLNKYRDDLQKSYNSIETISDPDLAETLVDVYGRMILLYEKNKDKPYFAKLSFLDDKSKKQSSVLIGRIGFANLNDDDIIVDWRAPISELYYNGKIGRAKYFVDNKEITGELMLKRQIDFDNGEIVSVRDLENSLTSDEFLKPFLSESSDNRLKNIVATIQQEQNEIIRLPINDNLIVQGIAGSGKTTVALHRLSYLIYNNRKIYKPDSYFIISPNSIFKQYISTLLEDLDADLAESYSYENIVSGIIGNKYKFLKKHEQFEILNNKNIKCNYLMYKGSLEFKNIIDQFLDDYQLNLFKKDICANDVVLIDKDTAYNEYLNCKRSDLKTTIEVFNKRISFILQTSPNTEKAISEAYKKDIIGFKQKIEIERDISSGCKKVLKQVGKISPIEMYKSLIKNISKYSNYIELETLKNETLANLNKNTLAYDDLGAILYMSTKIKTDANFEKIKHVLIDEAQDFSFLQFCAISKLFSNATFSIFGDIAQAIYSYQSITNWKEIACLFNGCKYLRLNKCYRTTIEITENANKTLQLMGLNSAENVIRHGDPVEEIKATNILEALECQINWFNKSEFKTMAIICKNNKELIKAEQLLSNFSTETIDEQSNSYSNNKISLTTVMASKGLEFDCVIIFNENSYNNSILDQKQLYVAKTRALHKLITLKY